MFKRPQQSGSTKQLKKTKLIDSYKNIVKEHSQTDHHPTSNHTINMRNKIMLTDLCPQEKLKIGDLIKTLETRKKQNKALQEKIQQMEIVESQHSNQLSQLAKALQEYSEKNKEQLKQISLLLASEEEKQKEIKSLKEQLSAYKGKQQVKVDQFAMTDIIFTNNQACQAVPKRKKQKQKQIQTQPIQIRYDQQGKLNRSRGYPANSKSFQKIMKGSNNNLSLSSKKNSRGLYPDSNRKYSKTRNRNRQDEIKISDEYDDPENSYQNSGKFYKEDSDHQEQNQEETEEFDELAKKWLQLKERNMSKIKESYRNSKKKMGQDDDYPTKQFNKGNHDYEEQSFGPQNYQRANDSDEFDEEQLNKILKSKNFSASRLLQDSRMKKDGSANRIGGNVSPKKSLSNYQHQNNVKKVKKNVLQKSNASNSRNIDFYETDLLDLVSSINPH